MGWMKWILESVDLVSPPPYDNLREYNDSSSWDFETFKEVWWIDSVSWNQGNYAGMAADAIPDYHGKKEDHLRLEHHSVSSLLPRSMDSTSMMSWSIISISLDSHQESIPFVILMQNMCSSCPRDVHLPSIYWGDSSNKGLVRFSKRMVDFNRGERNQRRWCWRLSHPWVRCKRKYLENTIPPSVRWTDR